MPLSYRVRHLPLHQPLTLVAQTGARSSAAWCVVGTLVRTPEGLNAQFLDSAMVCEPAWQACRESVALGAETPCRFGVLTDTGVTIIGEGPITSRVAVVSQGLAERYCGLSYQERRARRERDAYWRSFFRRR
jgi:hypothetical protein